MVELTADQWSDVNELALWIHRQQDAERIQRGLLERLGALIPHDFSWYDLCQVSGGQQTYFNPISTTMSEKQLSDYYEHYADSDYVPWMFGTDQPLIYRDFDVITPEARERARIYQEWMKPFGIYYGMGCTVVDSGVLYGSVTCFRRQDRDDFSDADLRILEEVERHLGVQFSLLWPDGMYPTGREENIALLARESQLTEREAEVLRLVADSLTNRQIADRLFISESTVKKHLNSLFRKIGVDNRVQAARLLQRRQQSPRG